MSPITIKTINSILANLGNVRESLIVSKKGKKSFSSTENSLRSPIEVVPGIFAETNYSAQDLVDQIAMLLQFFDVAGNEMKIYLREDRNA